MKPEQTKRKVRLIQIVEDVESLTRYHFDDRNNPDNERAVVGLLNELKRELKTMTLEEIDTFERKLQLAQLQPEKFIAAAWGDERLETF